MHTNLHVFTTVARVCGNLATSRAIGDKSLKKVIFFLGITPPIPPYPTSVVHCSRRFCFPIRGHKYAHPHTHTRRHTHTQTHLCTPTYVVNTYTNTHTHTHKYTHDMHMHITHAHTRTHTHTHIHIHTHTRTNTFLHTYIRGKHIHTCRARAT